MQLVVVRERALYTGPNHCNLTIVSASGQLLYNIADSAQFGAEVRCTHRFTGVVALFIDGVALSVIAVDSDADMLTRVSFSSIALSYTVTQQKGEMASFDCTERVPQRGFGSSIGAGPPERQAYSDHGCVRIGRHRLGRSCDCERDQANERI